MQHVQQRQAGRASEQRAIASVRLDTSYVRGPVLICHEGSNERETAALLGI